MMNRDKYKFADFTLETYGEMMALAKSKYSFSSYDTFRKDELFCLLRHDIDFSLEAALRMAKVEHQHGVKATYFVYLHSEFYNLLEEKSRGIISEIKSLGHDVGIHFDIHYYKIKTVAEIEQWLGIEKMIFSTMLNVEAKAFSFHNTNEFVFTCEEDMYCGLTNTYSHFFKKQCAYCSDSNGYWKFESLKEVLEKSVVKPLQLLIHPGWWTHEVLSPKDRIRKVIEEDRELLLTWYYGKLEEIGRPIIGE